MKDQYFFWAIVAMVIGFGIWLSVSYEPSLMVP